MSFAVDNRIVYTYQPERWPEGVITGYANDGMFYVEHVIVFPWAPSRALLGMIRCAMSEARARGFKALRFTLPATFPLTPKLMALAWRLGFDRCEDTYTKWVA